MNALEATQIRELAANELDLVSGAEILMSFDFFWGSRLVVGVDGSGTAYACYNSETKGTCIRGE
jgi:hypothetical protein